MNPRALAEGGAKIDEDGHKVGRMASFEGGWLMTVEKGS